MSGNKDFYFTFAINHPLADFVQQVSAPDQMDARRGMYRFYADRWALCYTAAEVSPTKDDDLVELPMSTFMKRLPDKIVVDGDEIYTEHAVDPKRRTS